MQIKMKTTDKPILQEFHIEGVKHISPEEAFRMVQNNQAILIDVREQNEVELESIALENVLYHPMSVIIDRLPYIAKGQNIILGCPGGVRSSRVANLLNLQAYPSVANLDGGFQAWIKMGLPWNKHVSFGMAAGCGCDCGCSTTSANKVDGSCC